MKRRREHFVVSEKTSAVRRSSLAETSPADFPSFYRSLLPAVPHSPSPRPPHHISPSFPASCLCFCGSSTREAQSSVAADKLCSFQLDRQSTQLLSVDWKEPSHLCLGWERWEAFPQSTRTHSPRNISLDG